MKRVWLLPFCLFYLLVGCSPSFYLEKKPYIDEFDNMDEIKQSLKVARNPKNWKQFKPPMKATFCISQMEGCTVNKVYTITSYLPKKYLGYWYIIFRNDHGKESIFLWDNLPYQDDITKIENRLKKVDP